MKQFLTIAFFLLMASSSSFAINADLFQIDDQAIQTELSELTQLESLVAENPALTYNEISSSLDFELESNSYALMASKFTLDDMEWIPFLWGFLCCPVGLFVVVTNDSSTKDEKTSYWLGVAANVVISGIVNIIVYTSANNALTP